MSVKVMTWVFQSSQATGSDRLVLLTIADRTNDEGLDAWPSVPTIATKARMDPRTVQRSLVRLEALGELQIERREGRSSQYAIVMQTRLPLSVETPTPGNLSPPAICHPRQSVTPDKLPGRQPCHHPPGSLPGDPSSTYKSTHTARARGPQPSSTGPVLAYDGRPPVPAALHQAFISKLGGDATLADTRLRAWYLETSEAWREQAIGDDDYRFWRLRFQETVGTTRRTRASPRSGRRIERDPFVTELLDALSLEGLNTHACHVWFGAAQVHVSADAVRVLVATPEQETWIGHHYADALDRACARAWPGRTVTLAACGPPAAAQPSEATA